MLFGFFDIRTEINSALCRRIKIFTICVFTGSCFQQKIMLFQLKISKRNETLEICKYFWIQEVILVVLSNITNVTPFFQRHI